MGEADPFSSTGVIIPRKDDSALPLPTMTKGALAAFKTETASLTAVWSAKLSGGGGQQDTSLQEKNNSSVFYI